MTNRERFNRIISYQKPDRAPCWLLEGVSEQAERVWYMRENFPLGMKGEDAIGNDVRLFSDFHSTGQKPLPSFVPSTIESNDEYTITQDFFGNTVKTLKRQSITPTQYVYIDAPLRTRKDWRKMKKRFDPTDIRRYPEYWGQEMFDYYNNLESPVSFGMSWGPGRGIKNGYMFGFERLMEIFMEEPELLEDMFDFWQEYTITYLRRFTDHLNIDVFLFNEDGMGYKNSSLISPDLFNRIYKPYMRKVCDFLRSQGVKVIGYYSSGNLKPLIRCFLEVGINCILPMECAAGMDAIELRREYGKDLLMIGNISRTSIEKGKEAIREEVLRKVPPLIEDGGYIPGIDDIIMPDMKLSNVKYCIDLIKSIQA